MCHHIRSTAFVAVFGVAAALSCLACASPQSGGALFNAPTTPSTAAAPDPNSVLAPSNGPWTLTTALTSMSGPLDCFDYPLTVGVPSVDSFPMTVTRTTTAVTIQCCGIPGNDAARFVARMTGDTFAVTVPYAITFPSRCDTPSSSTVTGTFSTDGRHFTAWEADTAHAPTGDTILTARWTADAGHQLSKGNP